MDSLLNRYRNVTVLVLVIMAQLVLLAYQVKTGEQHKYLGGIREAEIMHGRKDKDVAGNMIDKDHKQRQTAQHINPRIALELCVGRGI